MNVCSSCGYEEVSSNPLTCKVCGKDGCKDCMTYLFSFFQYGLEPQFHENWYCHSNECYEVFAKKMEDSITYDTIDREKFGIGLLKSIFHNAIKNWGNHLWLRKIVSNSLLYDDFLFTNGNLELVSRVEDFGNRIVKKNK